jgi:hypothetical protein
MSAAITDIYRASQFHHISSMLICITCVHAEPPYWLLFTTFYPICMSYVFIFWTFPLIHTSCWYCSHLLTSRSFYSLQMPGTRWTFGRIFCRMFGRSFGRTLWRTFLRTFGRMFWRMFGRTFMLKYVKWYLVHKMRFKITDIYWHLLTSLWLSLINIYKIWTTFLSTPSISLFQLVPL